MIVHQMQGIGVLSAFIVLFGNYRKKIITPFGVIFPDDILHAFLPFDGQLLTSLAPTVNKDTVLEVLLFQIGHIHK